MPLATATTAGTSARVRRRDPTSVPVAACCWATCPSSFPVWELLAETTRRIAEAHAMSTRMTLRPRKRRWEYLAYLDGQALPHLHRHLISLRPGTRT
jgi:hypothetical protein